MTEITHPDYSRVWREVMLIACRQGHREMIQKLAPVIPKDPEYVDALWDHPHLLYLLEGFPYSSWKIECLCETGDLDQIIKAVERKSKLHFSHLAAAAKNHHWKVVEYLLDQGLNDDLDPDYWGSYHWENSLVIDETRTSDLIFRYACRDGELEIVKRLIKTENITTQCDYPIRIACWNGNLELVKILIGAGCQEYPYILAIRHPEVFKYLCSLVIPTERYTILTTAAQSGNLEIMEFLQSMWGLNCLDSYVEHMIRSGHLEM